MTHYKKITKQTENKFLNLYKLDAINKKGDPFEYFFASRNSQDRLKMITKDLQPEGLVIYSLLKEDPSKLVLIRQYRYPLDEILYELPAGLVDSGEKIEEAAIREMREETGLNLTIYQGGNPDFRRAFFMGAGFTDETSSTVFGWADGTKTTKLQEESEFIEAVIVGKEEARQILHNEKISLRCAFLLMLFLRSDETDPFAFLE